VGTVGPNQKLTSALWRVLVSLKDRLGPVPTTLTPQSAKASNPERLLLGLNGPLNGPDSRNLRSRISDPPSMTPISPEVRKRKTEPPPPASVAPPPKNDTSWPPGMYNQRLNVFNDGPSTTISASLSQPAAAAPLTHPLPPRPVLPMGGPARGVKRERPPSPDLSMDFPQPRNRAFRWPTVDSHYSTPLKGEGELAIRTITFSSDGSHFALSCK
jgi:hypothetical protein